MCGAQPKTPIARRILFVTPTEAGCDALGGRMHSKYVGATSTDTCGGRRGYHGMVVDKYNNIIYRSIYLPCIVQSMSQKLIWNKYLLVQL